jgi:dUTP pyrophosphatase
MKEPLFHYNEPFSHDRSSSNQTDTTIEEQTIDFIESATLLSQTLSNDARHMKFFRSRKDLYLPRKSSNNSVGWDLYTLPDFDYTLPVGQSRLIPLGIRFQFPKGYYGQLFSKSSIAFQHGIYVHGGVIDPDHEGDIYVLLHNFGNKPFRLSGNMRICQLILLQYENTIDRLVEVSHWEDLGDTFVHSRYF